MHTKSDIEARAPQYGTADTVLQEVLVRTTYRQIGCLACEARCWPVDAVTDDPITGVLVASNIPATNIEIKCTKVSLDGPQGALINLVGSVIGGTSDKPNQNGYVAPCGVDLGMLAIPMGRMLEG